MMPYRTLDQHTWFDPRLRGSAFEVKGLYFYLATHPLAHISGLYRMPRVLMAHDTGLPEDRLENRLQHLVQREMIQLDDANELVWVVDLLTLQGFREVVSEKLAMPILKYLRDWVHSPLVQAWADHYQGLRVVQPKVRQHQDEVVYIGSIYPIYTLLRQKEKGKRQEVIGKRQKASPQNLASATPQITPSTAPIAPPKWPSPEALLEFWNTNFVALGAVPYPEEDLPDIRPLINEALKAKSGRAFWEERLLHAFEASDFLRGLVTPRPGQSRWRKRLPWLFQWNNRHRKMKNYVLIAQGEYDKRQGETAEERDRRLIELVKDLEDPHDASRRLSHVRQQAGGHR
jgi:hypothetical protein